ncbi:MAG TPA: cupredoxin domain-containing protein [Candidatus Binataceae bacterium]|nr:cupredoxin domain-containing protein [Candidatus Binataceae bacterium]
MKTKTKRVVIFLGTFALSSMIAGSWAPSALAQDPQVIDITAKRFAFSPNEVHLKAGQPVTLHLVSEDVTHGFFSRPLGLDETIPAKQSVDVKLTPRTPGKYSIICDNFCGSGHGNMKMTFVVE